MSNQLGASKWISSAHPTKTTTVVSYDSYEWISLGFIFTGHRNQTKVL